MSKEIHPSRFHQVELFLVRCVLIRTRTRKYTQLGTLPFAVEFADPYNCIHYSNDIIR